ncbi:MAG: glycosyltransferase [Ilumatobacteraceae bacterium]|nr:glycosyltransferase [Ilumatobacteraceae bacterium]
MRAALSKFEVRLAAGLLAFAFLVRWPTFITRLFDPDEAAIGVQGMVVRSGGKLYRDIFDRKPPLPPLAYAASFSITGSTDVRPLRVVVTLCLAGAAIIVALDAHRRHGRATAWWAGALVVSGAMALFPADAGGANYAHFALLPGAAAVVWSRRTRRGWAVAAGVALGLAILCRQSWVLGLVPAVYAAYRAGRWRQVVLLLASAALVVLSTGLVAPLGAFWEWTFANSPGFVFAPAGLGVSFGRGAASLATFVGFHVTAVACLVIAWRRRPPLRRAGREDRDLWLWLLVGLGSVAAGLRFFGHYWLQVVPALAVLAAPVAAGLGRRWRRWAAIGIVVPGAVAFALLFVPGSFHHRPDPTRLATEVDSMTTSSDRVLVWGSYPEVLVRADRLPAGGLVHMDFVTGRSGGRDDPADTLKDATPGALDIVIRSLREHPPTLVLDTSTAPHLGYEAYPLSVIPEIAAFVADGYTPVDVIDGVTVYRRNGS